MMIKKDVWKVALLLLVMCAASLGMISGTWAKYISNYEGNDKALVAKWNVKGTGDFKTNGETVTLDLFSHKYNKNIAALPVENLIAPGIAGEFVLSFEK
jgi:hypothetical protein